MLFESVSKGYFLIVAFTLKIVMISAAGNIETEENVYRQLSALQCDSLVKANDTNPNFVILDVRTKLEWEQEHLQGAIYRSTGDQDFETKIDALPRHKTYLLHCRSGGRSAAAFALMKELEFAEVYEMIGGIISWNNNQLPVTTDIEPRLMLVSYSELIKGSTSDTVQVTITNRANGNLKFTDFMLSDSHLVEHDFNSKYELAGAEDYTFNVVHSPFYVANDSTQINIDSNGGLISFKVGSRGISTNINDQLAGKLILYPNPAKHYLYIRNIELMTLEEISVINLLGQKVLNHSNVSTSNGIDVSKLKNGIYFLQIKKGNQFILHKFIIKH